MASVISTSCPPSRLGASQPSISCAIKGFERLRVQSPSLCSYPKACYGFGMSNLNVEFHSKVYNSIQSRCSKSTRGHFTMMPVGTPRVPYRNPGERHWQWVDLWNALYRERIVFIGRHINEEFGNMILATILYLDTIDDSKKLHFFINGRGGDLTPSLAVFDTMQSLKTPVCTLCVGAAYNMAAFLLVAGDKGYRSAMPISRITLQGPAGAARGQADDIQNEMDQLLKARDYLFRELAKKTGQPEEKIFKDLVTKKSFSAQEAVEYGIIDRVTRYHSKKLDPVSKEVTAGLG